MLSKTIINALNFHAHLAHYELIHLMCLLRQLCSIMELGRL